MELSRMSGSNVWRRLPCSKCNRLMQAMVSRYPKNAQEDTCCQEKSNTTTERQEGSSANVRAYLAEGWEESEPRSGTPKTMSIYSSSSRKSSRRVPRVTRRTLARKWPKDESRQSSGRRRNSEPQAQDKYDEETNNRTQIDKEQVKGH